MHYFFDDVAYLFRKGPYLHLARPRSALRYVRYQVEAGEECIDTLRLYPGVRIETLEFHYACLFGLGALDGDLLDDLLVEFAWRGVVWGSFLAALMPRPEFAESLSAALARVSHNRWLVEAALDVVCAREPTAERRAFIEETARMRALLAPLAHRRVPLRRAPTQAQAAQLQREREAIRAAYERSGLAGARAALKGTLLAAFLRPYPEWIRSTRAGVSRPDARV